MLALKALGVSMLALMLSAIIGLKKLSEGGGDSGHHVQYVTSDHRRKRRDLQQEEFDENVIPLPYRGWTAKID